MPVVLGVHGRLGRRHSARPQASPHRGRLSPGRGLPWAQRGTEGPLPPLSSPSSRRRHSPTPVPSAPALAMAGEPSSASSGSASRGRPEPSLTSDRGALPHPRWRPPPPRTAAVVPSPCSRISASRSRRATCRHRPRSAPPASLRRQPSAQSPRPPPCQLPPPVGALFLASVRDGVEAKDRIDRSN